MATKFEASYKQIWSIAYPLMLATLANNLSNLINTAFMGQLGEIDLGAAGIGGVMYFSITMISFGLGTGSQILISRKLGEGKEHEVGGLFRQNLYLFLAMAVLLYVLFFGFAPYMLHSMLKSPGIAERSIDYLHYRTWGIAFTLANIAFRGFYTGTGNTKPISKGIWLMAIINVSLDYLLIFGHGGFPAMGIKGAGLASCIAEAVAVIYYLSQIQYSGLNKKFNLFGLERINIKAIKEILELSLPMVGQYLVSLGAWFLFFVAIEQLGSRELASSNALRSLYMLIMTPIWGFGSAITTITSNLLGQDSKNNINSLIKKGIVISTLANFLVILPCAIFPYQVISLFTNDTALIAQSVPTLYVILGAMFIFGVATAYFSALSGTGDTKAAMLIEFSAIFIYAIYLVIVCIIYPQNSTIAWMAEFLYWGIQGGFAYWRLRSNKWRAEVSGLRSEV